MNMLLRSSGGRRMWAALLSAVLVTGGCSGVDPVPSPPPEGPGQVLRPTSAPAAPPPIQAYDTAVISAAAALFNNARLPQEGALQGRRYPVVIDPLIDGVTGTQSVATRSMGERLVQMMREHYPQYDVQPFSAANVARSPLVLIGTLTGVNAQRQASGERQAYRICLALADLRSGKLVGKGLAFALAPPSAREKFNSRSTATGPPPAGEAKDFETFASSSSITHSPRASGAAVSQTPPPWPGP